MTPAPQEKTGFSQMQNSPMMNEIRRQRQAPEPMDVLDILKKTVGARGSNPFDVYNTLANLVKNNPDFRIMRANNTLFAYNNNKDGSIDASMETADSPRALVDSLKQFSQAAKVAGFKQIRFPVGNPQILRAFRMAGYEPKTQSTGGFMEDGQTPAMMAVVEV